MDDFKFKFKLMLTPSVVVPGLSRPNPVIAIFLVYPLHDYDCLPLLLVVVLRPRFAFFHVRPINARHWVESQLRRRRSRDTTKVRRTHRTYESETLSSGVTDGENYQRWRAISSPSFAMRIAAAPHVISSLLPARQMFARPRDGLAQCPRPHASVVRQVGARGAACNLTCYNTTSN